MTAPATPVLIIAEAGSVHDGSFGIATRLVDVAAECGVDLVKFQTHIAAAETLRGAPTPPYFKGEPRFEYFERTAFTREQWVRLKAHCESRKVEFMSSPFSVEAVELLESIGMARYKIPSGEVTNLPYLEAIARTGKPVILSSGMSSWRELDAAVETVLRRHDRLTILQCTTEYPCPPEQVGLNVMLEMRARYGRPVGLSDHTLTSYAAFAAVTLGASVIEKHFTLSRHLYGSDAKHSLEPGELADMVRGIRAIEAMLANPVDKESAARFKAMKETFEKSVVSVAAIPAGAVLSAEMLAVKKPGTGIPAARLSEVIGRRAARAIPPDTLLGELDVVWDGRGEGR
ncbi:MAG: N-acetylneuraminate synthase family protein [Candidatus Rokubacteria bacterium]|nr:N-acetylneuraminate synthase family protein [Candidatus Rokubacteria bacterium]